MRWQYNAKRVSESTTRLRDNLIAKSLLAARDARGRGRPAIRTHDVPPGHHKSPRQQYGLAAAADVLVQAVAARDAIVAEFICTVIPATW